MNRKTRLSISSVFMLSSPWGESHCSMSLFNLIPLSSQTVLTTLLSPHNLPCITCANLFCQTGSYTVHSWSFLAFYHRSSTNVELQLPSFHLLDKYMQASKLLPAEFLTAPRWEIEEGRWINILPYELMVLNLQVLLPFPFYFSTNPQNVDTDLQSAWKTILWLNSQCNENPRIIIFSFPFTVD